jgi:hypothetical protein
MYYWYATEDATLHNDGGNSNGQSWISSSPSTVVFDTGMVTAELGTHDTNATGSREKLDCGIAVSAPRSLSFLFSIHLTSF